jgi:drug/metabolite transporter (DMT)-like permease
MKRKNKLGGILFLMVLFSAVFAKDAYAYLDPGTGSYFLQLVIAGLLGALFFVKTFWRGIFKSIKTVFSRLFNPVKKDKNE